MLCEILESLGLPIPEKEYRFHRTRKWRFDYAYPEEKVAIEVEGGVWTGGRHIRSTGFLKDMEKYNEAGLLGWRIFRITPGMITDGNAVTLIERIFQIDKECDVLDH